MPRGDTGTVEGFDFNNGNRGNTKNSQADETKYAPTARPNAAPNPLASCRYPLADVDSAEERLQTPADTAAKVVR